MPTSGDVVGGGQTSVLVDLEDLTDDDGAGHHDGAQEPTRPTGKRRASRGDQQ